MIRLTLVIVCACVLAGVVILALLIAGQKLGVW